MDSSEIVKNIPASSEGSSLHPSDVSDLDLRPSSSSLYLLQVPHHGAKETQLQSFYNQLIQALDLVLGTVTIFFNINKYIKINDLGRL